MVRRTRRKLDAFAHPSADFDYSPLLETLAACRKQVLIFQCACGPRNPAFNEARLLIEQIRAVALLTRAPNAERRVLAASHDVTGPNYHE